MAKSLNKWMGIGNLGKDPEVRYTASGTAVASVSIATSSSYKDRDGNWQDKTEWVNLVFWSRLAEIASEYLHKGSKVYVEGRLETQSWEDKDSKKRMYRTQIVVQDLVMLDKREDGGNDRHQESESRSRRSEARPASDQDPITDDDIPFISNGMIVLESPSIWRRYDRKYV